MSNNNYDKKYCFKNMKFVYKLFDELNPYQVANRLKVDKDTILRIYEDKECVEAISFAVATRISEYLNIPIEDMMNEADINSGIINDRTFYALAEEIIMGLKEKIYTRLASQGHSRDFINEIIDVVDNIIIESAYLGRELTKEKRDDLIVKSIIARRK